MSKLIHIVDWASSKSIRIDEYPMYGHFGWSPYALFTVYPASGVTVKTNIGIVTDKGMISKLVSESISISKTINPASMKIDSLVSQSGLLFDENDFAINPILGVSNGMLIAPENCSGTVVIEYWATVRLYQYDAQIEGITAASIKTGTVWAYDAAAPKNIVTYPIPPLDFKSAEQTRVARVYREILVADKRYEMPDTFTDTTISYTNYPTADVSELDISTRKDELTQEELLWDGVTVQIRDRYSKDWCYPVTDHLTGFTGVQWKFSSEIPDGLNGNAEIASAVAALKAKYGVI